MDEPTPIREVEPTPLLPPLPHKPADNDDDYPPDIPIPQQVPPARTGAI